LYTKQCYRLLIQKCIHVAMHIYTYCIRACAYKVLYLTIIRGRQGAGLSGNIRRDEVEVNIPQ
jgi:hypothetical protein